jgi:hypothetical protein
MKKIWTMTGTTSQCRMRARWRPGTRGRRVVLAALATLLAGCGADGRMYVSTAPAPLEASPNRPMMAALSCIRDSGVLRNIRFAVAVHADGTGRIAMNYEGATGNFLPQGTSAIWAAQAVMYAGGTAQNYYELNTERALRQFGGDPAARQLTERLMQRMPEFVISTAFTALDFLGGPSADVRVSGVGPLADLRGASLEVSAELYRPGDRTTLAISSISRQVLYRNLGVGIGRLVGGGTGTLVTGGITWSDQQRLQESARDAIVLSVADVMSRVPGVPSQCRQAVEELLNGRQGTRSISSVATQDVLAASVDAAAIPAPASPPALGPGARPQGARGPLQPGVQLVSHPALGRAHQASPQPAVVATTRRQRRNLASDAHAACVLARSLQRCFL